MAITGRGSTIGYATLPLGNNPTYTMLATAITIDGPGITVGEVETTLLSSRFKPYLPTLPEGECSLTIEVDNTDPGVVAFRNLITQAGVPIFGWQITYQDGAIDTFLAFPKGFKVEGNENETRVTGSIDLRLTTPITAVAPAAPRPAGN